MKILPGSGGGSEGGVGRNLDQHAAQVVGEVAKDGGEPTRLVPADAGLRAGREPRSGDMRRLCRWVGGLRRWACFERNCRARFCTGSGNFSGDIVAYPFCHHPRAMRWSGRSAISGA